MRDPDLLTRAEGAAGELEKAWAQWRETRGLSSTETVTSYVAHSVDRPDGQPRVVLGLDAAEAEALATMLGQQEQSAPLF